MMKMNGVDRWLQACNGQGISNIFFSRKFHLYQLMDEYEYEYRRKKPICGDLSAHLFVISTTFNGIQCLSMSNLSPTWNCCDLLEDHRDEIERNIDRVVQRMSPGLKLMFAPKSKPP